MEANNTNSSSSSHPFKAPFHHISHINKQYLSSTAASMASSTEAHMTTTNKNNIETLVVADDDEVADVDVSALPDADNNMLTGIISSTTSHIPQHQLHFLQQDIGISRSSSASGFSIAATKDEANTTSSNNREVTPTNSNPSMLFSHSQSKPVAFGDNKRLKALGAGPSANKQHIVADNDSSDSGSVVGVHKSSHEHQNVDLKFSHVLDINDDSDTYSIHNTRNMNRPMLNQIVLPSQPNNNISSYNTLQLKAGNKLISSANISANKLQLYNSKSATNISILSNPSSTINSPKQSTNRIITSGSPISNNFSSNINMNTLISNPGGTNNPTYGRLSVSNQPPITLNEKINMLKPKTRHDDIIPNSYFNKQVNVNKNNNNHSGNTNSHLPVTINNISGGANNVGYNKITSPTYITNNQSLSNINFLISSDDGQNIIVDKDQLRKRNLDLHFANSQVSPQLASLQHGFAPMSDFDDDESILSSYQ